MPKNKTLTITTRTPHSNSYFIHCKVPFVLKDAFKQAVGYWLEWDERNFEWLVENKEGERQGLEHFQGLLECVESPPGRIAKKMSKADRIKVRLDVSKEPLPPPSHLPRTVYDEAFCEEEVDDVYNDDEAYYTDLEEDAEIHVVRVDTGYGLLTAAGPDNSFPYGKRTQYCLLYSPHGAPPSLQRQFMLVSGRREWDQLLRVASAGGHAIKERLACLEAGDMMTVSPDADRAHTEISVEKAEVDSAKASALGVTFHLRPAFGHSAGINGTSLMYFPSGDVEMEAFLTGLGGLSLGTDNSIEMFRAHPWHWLAGRYEKQHALNAAPTVYHKPQKLVFRRASYDRASRWVDQVVSQLP